MRLGCSNLARFTTGEFNEILNCSRISLTKKQLRGERAESFVYSFFCNLNMYF